MRTGFFCVDANQDWILSGSSSLSNLFNLSYNAISALRKADLVQQIIDPSGKFIVDSDLRNLCDQISIFFETTQN